MEVIVFYFIFDAHFKMMQKKDSFFINRIKSIGIAAKGALLLIKNEASIKVQIVVTILVTCAGFYFDISNTE